jgi:hypothetical protein
MECEVECDADSKGVRLACKIIGEQSATRIKKGVLGFEPKSTCVAIEQRCCLREQPREHVVQQGCIF